MKENTIEQKFENFTPCYFNKKQNIFVFRDEDGNIAVGSPDNIIISCTPEDTVDLLTLTKNKNSVCFWSITTCYTTTFYALTSPEPFTLPAGIIFDNIYYNRKSHVFYVTYRLANSYGVISVSSVSIRTIISHKNGFTHITYENGVFYAKKSSANSSTGFEYFVINETGRIIASHDTEVKKIDGFQMFYDKRRIFSSSFSKELFDADIIRLVEIVTPKKSRFTNKKIPFIKVTTETGIFYYSDELKPII